MSRFSQLIDAVADQKNHSLSDVLLRAKVLAYELRGRKFRQWIEWELNGYDSRDDLPKYRIVNAKLYGNFAGYAGSERNRVPLSISHLPQETIDRFQTDHMMSSVSYIEDLISGDKGVIGMFLDGSAVNYLRNNSTSISNMVLNLAFKELSRHALLSLLTSVRSSLLDFLLDLREKHPELDKDESAPRSLSERDVDAVVERRVYQHCSVVEEQHVGDSYQAGQAGAMGPGSQAKNMNFGQILRDGIGGHSLAELASDLEKVRAAMLKDAKAAEQDEAVAAVASAEDAAKKGDAKGVLGFLKKAGAWSLDVATKIGSDVAAKAIQRGMGL